jgi:hypothetical protein
VAVGIILAVIVAAIGAGFVVVLFAAGRSFFQVGTNERRHLDEIPIDRADACGKVESIHEALGSFTDSYAAARFGISPEDWKALRTGSASGHSPEASATPPRAWPTVEADVDGAAQRLDLVIADAIPHFPRRLAKELSIVRESIADGRRQLADVDDAQELDSLTGRAFDRGQLHTGYAGDLVGDQCSVPLGV